MTNLSLENIADIQICDDCGSMHSGSKYSDCPICRLEIKIGELHTKIEEVLEVLNAKR